MGKKKQNVNYDRKALENLTIHIEKARQPLKDGNIPKLNIDLELLEKTIKSLSKKERELMEKFWGLIPGTPIRSENILFKINKDTALRNMLNAAYEIVEKLISIEYLYLFDIDVKNVVDRFATRIDKSGYEEISDMDAIKYLIIFLVFIACGPQMIYESEGIKTITEKEEKIGYFDNYSLLQASWYGSAKNFPEKSIKLGLIISAIEMFNVKDVIAMRKYVNLPIGKEFEGIETDDVKTFQQIRHFKEKIFPNGAWDNACAIIYGDNIERDILEKFCEHFPEFRADWGSLRKFKKGKVTIETSEGRVKIPEYKIEELYFTDVYEVMFLYLSRKYIM